MGLACACRPHDEWLRGVRFAGHCNPKPISDRRVPARCGPRSFGPLRVRAGHVHGAWRVRARGRRRRLLRARGACRRSRVLVPILPRRRGARRRVGRVSTCRLRARPHAGTRPLRRSHGGHRGRRARRLCAARRRMPARNAPCGNDVRPGSAVPSWNPREWRLMPAFCFRQWANPRVTGGGRRGHPGGRRHLPGASRRHRRGTGFARALPPPRAAARFFSALRRVARRGFVFILYSPRPIRI